MESRVSATGLKSVELDELTTDQIIINNEGQDFLQVGPRCSPGWRPAAP